MNDSWSFETKQIHVGQEVDPTTGARALPIYQTTAFGFRDTEHAAALFGLAEPGNIYTRIMNPTQDVVEERIAALEGGAAALLVGSGMAATSLAILNIAEAGDHIVSSANLYGGTYNLFVHTLPKLGIEVTFVDDPDDLEQWRAAVRPNTKAFFGESIANPRSNILDIEGVAAVAHEAGVPLIVDNTIPTPYLVRPLEWGADIVVHSATKYLGGHGTAIAGVDRRRRHVRLGGERRAVPGLHQAGPELPRPRLHRRRVGPVAYIIKARVQLLRDLGPAIAPFNAFLHRAGPGDAVPADRAARRERPAGRRVAGGARRGRVRQLRRAAELSPWYERGKKYLPRGAGAVLAFELTGGLEAGRRFVDALTLHSHVANIGDVRCLVIHPASTTHCQLDGRGAARGGRHARSGPARGRPRAHRRHPRRPRGRVRGGQAR